MYIHPLINSEPTNNPLQQKLLQNMTYTRGIRRQGPLGGHLGQNSRPQVHYALDKLYIYNGSSGIPAMIYSALSTKENEKCRI